MDYYWTGNAGNAVDYDGNYEPQGIPGAGDTLFINPGYMNWPESGHSYAGLVYNAGQIKGGAWHGVVYNNDPFSIFTGLVDASGGPVFLNKVSFDMGLSWSYGPSAAELAAAADVRSGASNLGVPGSYDPITGNYTDPGASRTSRSARPTNSPEKR